MTKTESGTSVNNSTFIFTADVNDDNGNLRSNVINYRKVDKIINNY